MSTSLAVQPAYQTSKTERSKANPDRTIFGTTLDNYGKCWDLLADSKALKEASDLYEVKSGWHKRTPNSQRIVDRAWGLRDSKYPTIGEEFVTGLSQFKNEDLPVLDRDLNRKKQEAETLRDVASRTSEREYFPSSFAKNRSGRNCKSAFLNRNIDRPLPPRLFSARSPAKSTRSDLGKKRPMSLQNTSRRSVGGGSKVTVPKFRLPPDATNFMRVASLKITETGAKDLINHKKINKVGLGDTLQYDYQAFQRQETPQFYKGHGHVLLLGQRFTDETTSKDVTAPGGFYKLSTPDRNINEKHSWVQDRGAEVTMAHKRPDQTRRTNHENEYDDDYDITEDEIPLNIRHKYRMDDVTQVVKENKDELKELLRKSSDMRHTALVPARLDVKELNHPIDPPPSYFTNFGENLKYDKFEGGLHLYIK